MKIGFLGLLTILFIALKLTGYIAWSWWWVLMPMWIGIAFVLCMAVIAFCLAVAADNAQVNRWKSRK